MWIFTPEGFLSVVADKNNPREGELLVRACNREHLEALLPVGEPFSMSGSDYPWRCWARRQQVAELLVTMTWTTTYTNFKNAVIDPSYHDALVDVWQAMADYEQGLAWKPAPDPKAGRNGPHRKIRP